MRDSDQFWCVLGCAVAGTILVALHGWPLAWVSPVLLAVCMRLSENPRATQAAPDTPRESRRDAARPALRRVR